METFVAVVIIVFSILQVILFFKLWGMTNDVNSIKARLSDSDLITKAKVCVLSGDVAEAKRMLDESFLLEITRFEGKYETYYEFFEKKHIEYLKLYNDLGINPLDFESLKESSYKILG